MDKPPTLKLKPLSSHLYHAYLGESITVLYDMKELEEDKLLKVYREHNHWMDHSGHSRNYAYLFACTNPHGGHL